MHAEVQGEKTALLKSVILNNGEAMSDSKAQIDVEVIQSKIYLIRGKR